MLRQSVRKTSRKPVRKPAKRKVAKKASTQASTPSFIQKIKTFANNLGSYVEQRKKQTSGKDPVHKKLHTIHAGLQRELKKSNALNPNTAKHLKALTPALRGITKLPANIKGQVGKLMQSVRSQVRKEVLAHIKHFNALLTPLHQELGKLHTQLEAGIKKAKTQHIQWKIDPALKRRMSALSSHLSRYKTKWFSRLNKISTHGNAQVKSQVSSLKKKIDETQKLMKKNQTIVNRYAKSPKARKGFKTQVLMNASQMKSLESKMSSIDSSCEKTRVQVEHFCDQLKAVKIF